jgi:hypothetical protein
MYRTFARRFYFDTLCYEYEKGEDEEKVREQLIQNACELYNLS